MKCTVRFYGLFWYFSYLLYMKKIFKKLLKRTDSGYPLFLARGWFDRNRKEIVIWKQGNWILRYWHEIGHMVGFGHTKKKGHIMHPWGLFRGWDGFDEIKKELGDEFEYYSLFLD